jgi:MoCo/4Fe-4S cofactor protein with predicted Tat translocation signal
MLDACPHHHEEAVQVGPDTAAGMPAAGMPAAGVPDDALDGIQLRKPGQSKQLTGKKFWRSLEELSGSKSFETMLHREFPHAAAEWNDGASRRNFLKLMGASMALAGLSACVLKKPEEKIVPYVNPPEEVIPGRPLFFASTMPMAGYGKGVVVESHEGRPTKIEGNKDHPASLGTSDIFMQASILDLYDPDRSQTVRRANPQGSDDVSSWGEFADTLTLLIKKHHGNGSGLRFLTGTVTSPTIARMMGELLSKDFPNAKWHQYEPIGRRNEQAGAIAAFGKDFQQIFHFDKADVVLALDCDFLTGTSASLIYAKDFIDRRRMRLNKTDATMNRLYSAESTVTLTGAKADHRLAIKSGQIEALLKQIATVIAGGKIAADPKATPEAARQIKWATAVAEDLAKTKGRGLIVVGESQPPKVHELVHAIHDAIGAVGSTVSFVDPIEVAAVSGEASLEDLVKDMKAGIVDTLFILGTNPVYTAPPSFGLSQGLNGGTRESRISDFANNPLSKVPLVIQHGLYDRSCDETAVFAHWHLPASHYLESWGDIRSFEGTASVIQPLISPLYTTKTEIELLSMFRSIIDDKAELSGHDCVAATWMQNGPKLSHDDWQRVLEKGMIPGTASKPVAAPLKVKLAELASVPAPVEKEGAIELVIRPDPSVYDGRFTNNGWLQELPKSISLLTWENVALMSINTAKELGVAQSDEGKPSYTSKVTIKVGDVEKTLPALIMPGHAERSITVYLGYGRTRSGRVGKDIGEDVYALRPSANSWVVAAPDQIGLASGTAEVATSQSHHLIDMSDQDKAKLDSVWLKDRELIRSFTLKQVQEAKTPTPTEKPYRTIALKIHGEEIPDSEKLIPAHTDYNNPTHNPNFVHDPNFNKWGMVIDNQACIGCNACVIACQSENNIAIVGKEQVIKGREMHWIRIDTYFQGAADESPDVYFQPIPCMNCENAPCTLVCPVEATTVSEEGINEMTYNRCVGTRYCSNNCPYKVRRFNFLQFTDYDTPQFMLQRNPNVTVRSRGVMEKCNYCVQRVNNGRIEAKKQDRPVNPGEVVTACAQACPTHAIIFGNLNDDRWEVTRLQNEPLRYTLLDELNALPRTSYLSRVQNPNPVLAPPVADSE